MTKRDLRLLGASVIAMGAFLASAQASSAQDASDPAPSASVAQSVAANSVRIPEGTELRIRFEDKLSSATASSGDRFSISLDDQVTLADGTIVPAGYRGVGEVTLAEKKGYMGKAGQLNVRLDYIRIGDQRVRLRASKGQEGKGAVGATIALTVLFGPLGLLKRGHDIEIQPGQSITAYVDSDADIRMPLAAPPPT